MSEKKVPSRLFQQMKENYPEIFEAHEKLGIATREAGPIEGKNIELIKLAAAAASGLEGAVHSHTRRALAEGASGEEVYHGLMSLISTIGFPQTMAAISWSRDIIEHK